MFKPLLAAKADLSKLRFPLLASPKIDGIRCLTIDGAVTRTLKPIPNAFIAAQLAGIPSGLDGELVTLGSSGEVEDFNTIQSKVMRRDGEPNFAFMVFDRFDLAAPFGMRFRTLQNDLPPGPVKLVDHTLIEDASSLDAIEDHHVSEGWEGTMLRDPAGPYKHGRSTANEGILVKLKRFEDAEAEIIGTIEQMHNTNEAGKDAFGRTERSTAKAGMVGKDTLGALHCRWNGVEFDIGTGLSDSLRRDLWSRREAIVGQPVTFRFQGVGSGGAPRFPVFAGLRSDT